MMTSLQAVQDPGLAVQAQNFEYTVGARVQLQGIQMMPELNGAQGFVAEMGMLSGAPLYLITLDDGRSFNLKSHNVAPATAASALPAVPKSTATPDGATAQAFPNMGVTLAFLKSMRDDPRMSQSMVSLASAAAGIRSQTSLRVSSPAHPPHVRVRHIYAL